MAQSVAPLPARLLQQLDGIATAEGFHTYIVEHGAGSKDGDGFMSTLLAVTLIGERRRDDGLLHADRLKLICKLQPANESRQEQFQSAMLFNREVCAYNRILPAIEQFQRDRGLSSADGLKAYPKCYLACGQTETSEAIIIMQDLRTDGYALWDKRQPLHYANAKLLLEQLGLLHGVSVALRDQRPDVYADFEQLPDVFAEIMKSKTIQAMFMSTYDRVIGLLDNRQHIDILEAFKRDWRAINERCMDLTALGAFSVLGHGDCWNNNMMYATEQTGEQSVCILDWQLARITSPAVDLSYFLFSSTDKALRDQHMDELLGVYYTKFAGIVRQCGSDPEKLFTFDNLQAQLRSFGVYGVMTAPMLLSIMVSDAKDLVSMDELAENVGSEAQPDTHMAIFNERSERMYIQGVSDVIDDAIKYGWLPDYV